MRNPEIYTRYSTRLTLVTKNNPNCIKINSRIIPARLKIILKSPNKVEACLEEHVEYFIDDKEKTLDTLNEVGIKCIKIKSIDKSPSKYFSVNNWKEILDFFN